MDSGISAVRNLLYIVLVLVVLSVCANIYLGTQLATNSEDLQRLGMLLQKQLMTTATQQSEQLQQKMDKLDQDAAGIDAKMDQAQKDMIAKERVELPNIMDNYFRTRAPWIEKQAIKQVNQQQH